MLVRSRHAHAKLDAVEELLVGVVGACCGTDGRCIQALYAGQLLAAHESLAWAAEVPEEARLVDHEGLVFAPLDLLVLEYVARLSNSLSSHALISATAHG
jgi:hypothetical protein